MRSTRILSLLVGALLALGCGKKPVADPNYPGEPLATLKGQLQVAPGGSNPGMVRLALAWYKDYYESNASDPNSLITQDVVYQGTFPVDFSLDLTAPPPAGALTPAGEGGTGKVASAILIAYSDTNGDGQLNPISVGGPVTDHILGSSVSFFGTKDTYWLFYADGTPPSNWPQGTKKGYTIVHDHQDNGTHTTEVLDASKANIPIVLSGENELNALICKADYADYLINATTQSPNPLAFCGLPATPGKLRVTLFADRNVDEGLATTSDTVRVQLSDGANWISGATITVNGQTVPDDGLGDNTYALDDESGTWFPADAPINVSISAPGFDTVTYSLEGHGMPMLATPAVNATVSGAAALPITWSNAPNVFLNVFVQGGTDTQFWGDLPLATSSDTMPAQSFTGDGSVSLDATLSSLDDVYGSAFLRSANDSRPVHFGP